MPKYIALSAIRYDGERYAPGDDIDVDGDVAKQLLKSGSIATSDSREAEDVRRELEDAEARRAAREEHFGANVSLTGPAGGVTVDDVKPGTAVEPKGQKAPGDKVDAPASPNK
jgi:hypothetical protein